MNSMINKPVNNKNKDEFDLRRQSSVIKHKTSGNLRGSIDIIHSKIMNESSIRTSLDAKSQKDKIRNLSQDKKQIKVLSHNSNEFQIQWQNEENQEEYITTSKYDDKSVVQQIIKKSKNTLNAFTQTDSAFHHKLPEESKQIVYVDKINPSTEDKYCQAVEENDLQKLYDEWQKIHDKKVYLEKCFGSKIIHNSLSSDNFGRRSVYQTYSKKPELRTPDKNSQVKTTSNAENYYSPDKTIIKYSTGGGTNYDV